MLESSPSVEWSPSVAEESGCDCLGGLSGETVLFVIVVDPDLRVERGSLVLTLLTSSPRAFVSREKVDLSNQTPMANL